MRRSEAEPLQLLKFARVDPVDRMYGTVFGFCFTHTMGSWRVKTHFLTTYVGYGDGGYGFRLVRDDKGPL